MILSVSIDCSVKVPNIQQNMPGISFQFQNYPFTQQHVPAIPEGCVHVIIGCRLSVK